MKERKDEKMKKIASALASLMILASAAAIAPVTASADSLVAFEIGTAATTGAVSDGKLVQEETVLVPVSVTENVGMTTFLLEFANDGNFEVINATSDFGKGGDFKKLGSFTWNPEAQRVLWIEGSCRDTELCGIIANLEVVIPSGTPVGKYEISFNGDETQLTNADFDSLEYTLTSGYIEVGGDETSNPAEPQQTTAATQAPQPPATQAPAVTTTKAPVTQAPVVTTKAPSTTKAAETTTSRKNQAAPAETVGATSKPVAETVLESTDALSTAISSDSTDTSVSETTDISETSEATVSSGNASAKPSNNSNKNNNKNNVSKTDKSPSTGATGVVIPSILLAASSVGVVIAASKKKKK